MTERILATLLFILFGSQSKAQQWEEVTYRVPVNGEMTVNQLRNDAFFGAFAEAARRVAGVEVRASERLMTTEQSNTGVLSTYYQTVLTDSRARVIDVDTLTLGFESDAFYRVQVRVKIALEEGESDPAFFIDLETDQPSYTYSEDRAEEIYLFARPSGPGYLHLFHVNGSEVKQLFPNPLMGENRLIAGQEYIFPPPQWQKRGVFLRPSEPQDSASTSAESVLALYTKRPLRTWKRDDASIQDGVLQNLELLSIYELDRLLLGIPRNERAIATTSFRIDVLR